MTLKEMRSQLDSLRDNAKSFLQPDEPDSIWQADIDAIDATDSILGAISSFGFETPESFTRWLAETQELERLCAKHLNGRPHKKPPDTRPLDMLGLRHTTIDALRRNGITTIGQLEKLTPRQVWKMDGVGQVKMNDIECCLKRADKHLREEEQP